MANVNRGACRGFTMVELIFVLVIAGILAAVAMPRMMGGSTFDTRGFADELASTVRYAQKLAIAQRRDVSVHFTANDATLCYTAAAPCVAANLAPGPGGEKPYAVAAPNGIAIASPSAVLVFDAAGRPDLAAQLAILVNGTGTYRVFVERETGYVHD